MPQNIARLDYQTPGATIYLRFLQELEQKHLIFSSLDRDLTDSGHEVVRNAFGNALDIGRVVGTVKMFRQVNPDLSEVDAFVYEASDVVMVMSSDAQRRNIDVRECKLLMPRKGTYVLAGIHVLREAITTGMITVNPPGSHQDQCYLGYN